MLNDITFVDNKIGLKLGLKLVNLNHLSWRPLAGTNDFPESGTSDFLRTTTGPLQDRLQWLAPIWL